MNCTPQKCSHELCSHDKIVSFFTNKNFEQVFCNSQNVSHELCSNELYILQESCLLCMSHVSYVWITHSHELYTLSTTCIYVHPRTNLTFRQFVLQKHIENLWFGKKNFCKLSCSRRKKSELDFRALSLGDTYMFLSLLQIWSKLVLATLNLG